MLVLVRPVNEKLQCFVDPRGDEKTNRFIAVQLGQVVAAEECIAFACRDITGQVCSRNVWACPNWLVEELLVHRQAQNLAFDLYVREAQSDEAPHFALSLEDGQSPEEALRAVLGEVFFQGSSCDFGLTEVTVAPSDFAILLPSKRAPIDRAPSGSMRHSTPGVPPRHRKW